jgi:hypothetical protein
VSDAKDESVQNAVTEYRWALAALRKSEDGLKAAQERCRSAEDAHNLCREAATVAKRNLLMAAGGDEAVGDASALFIRQPEEATK